MSSEQDYAGEAREEYERLSEYAATRTAEITPMLQPYVDVTDRYGELLSRLCLILGELEPETVQDSAIRDLMADICDFLLEARPFILRGNTLVAFPLARRAYESMSLLHWCALDEKNAERWAKGKQIANAEVRKALGLHPMGESEERLRALYRFFSEMTHPNRDMIAFRGLGEGNRYVLGSIGKPNLVMLADYCMKHLELWFWLCPTVAYFYRERVFGVDPHFQDEHNKVRAMAQSVHAWLVEQYNRVLLEWKAESDQTKPKFA